MIRLVGLGVITEALPQQYALTPIGVLRRDVPGSMREWLTGRGPALKREHSRLSGRANRRNATAILGALHERGIDGTERPISDVT